MLKQAYEINSWGKNVYVKIPVVNSKELSIYRIHLNKLKKFTKNSKN